MAIEYLKIEVDVQMTIVKFREKFDNICAYHMT